MMCLCVWVDDIYVGMSGEGVHVCVWVHRFAGFVLLFVKKGRNENSLVALFLTLYCSNG